MGLKPTTFALARRRSNQLSYTRDENLSQKRTVKVGGGLPDVKLRKGIAWRQYGFIEPALVARSNARAPRDDRFEPAPRQRLREQAKNRQSTDSGRQYDGAVGRLLDQKRKFLSHGNLPKRTTHEWATHSSAPLNFRV